MKHLWTWSGKYFGYRNENQLRTRNGQHVGRFYGDEVYGVDGRYLGEIRNGNRLITKRSGKMSRRSSFSPSASASSINYAGYTGNIMIAGYEDFPDPEDF